MRILMSTDNVGGVWVYCRQLAGALAPRGVHVHLASMGAPVSAVQRAEIRDLPNVTLHESAYKLEWMGDPWEDVDRAAQWLLDIERETAPAVVHLNGYAHGAAPFSAPKLVVAHSCVTSWFRAVKGVDAPSWCDEYRGRVAQGLQGSDHVIAPSRAMLDCLAGIYGPPRSADVIYNARSGAMFRPAVKLPMVFSAGRFWDEAKGIATLDASAPQIAWPVYCAGDNSHPTAGTTVDSHNVQMLGFINERQLTNWLGQSSIYALPARYEPFGLSVLEAALCGCALVLGDIASLREIWEDAAVFVPPGDAPALADAVNHLITHPALRREMADRALTRARRFTPLRMADAYVRTYERLSGSRAATTDASALPVG